MTIHCTITSQIAQRPGYLDEFLSFWSGRPEIAKVWFSIFTPQIGATDPEILTPIQRASVIEELKKLRVKYPVVDMQDALIDEFLHPPKSPRECIFARTTETISADLTTQITPCQFGGEPDCEQCGCIASMGLAAVGSSQSSRASDCRADFHGSDRVGRSWQKLQRTLAPKPAIRTQPILFEILQPDLRKNAVKPERD